MSKVWKVDFYPQDWLIATSALDPAERGIYIQIVALIFAHSGPIPDDAGWIGSMSGCSTRMARSLIARLFDKGKIQILNGKISQKRAIKELDGKIKRLEKGPKTPRERDESAAKTPRERSENRAKVSPKHHEKDQENNDINGLGFRPHDVEIRPPLPHPTTSPTTTIDTNVSILSSTEAEMFFSALWEAYPGRGKYGVCGPGYKGSRKKAFEKFQQLLKKERDYDHFTRELVQSAYLYAHHLDKSGYPSKHLITWLNQECWSDDYSSGENRGGTGLQAVAEGFGKAIADDE